VEVGYIQIASEDAQDYEGPEEKVIKVKKAVLGLADAEGESK
jgi:hypothetical protein